MKTIKIQEKCNVCKAKLPDEADYPEEFYPPVLNIECPNCKEDNLIEFAAE